MIHKQSISITIFAIILLFVSGIVFLMFSPILIPEMQNSLRITIMKQTQQSLVNMGVVDYRNIEQLAGMSTRSILNDAIRMTIYSILIYISGIAILLRRNWGRLLFLCIIIAGFLSNLVGILIHKALLVPFHALHLLIASIVLFYLTRPRVKEQFK